MSVQHVEPHVINNDSAANGQPVTLTALSGEDTLTPRHTVPEDAPPTAATPRAWRFPFETDDFAEGVRLALRDRKYATWRYQVGYAVRLLPRWRRHPVGYPVHPMARLAAVILRRRFVPGARPRCCPADRGLMTLSWCPPIVICGHCGTSYRRV